MNLKSWITKNRSLIKLSALEDQIGVSRGYLTRWLKGGSLSAEKRTKLTEIIHGMSKEALKVE